MEFRYIRPRDEDGYALLLLFRRCRRRAEPANEAVGLVGLWLQAALGQAGVGERAEPTSGR
jgi:hypothetical protein